MSIITISRQYGCPADVIALKLSRLLNYRYLDKEVIKYVAMVVNLPEEKVMALDEDKHSNTRTILSKYFDIDIFKDMLSFNEDELNKEIESIKRERSIFDDKIIYDMILDAELFQKIVERIIISESKKNNIIIIGRGGQCILKDCENAIHVRMVAPLDERIKWVVENEGLSEEKAKDKILETDKRKRKFLKYYFKEDIEDCNLYHLCINLKNFVLEEVVELMSNIVSIKEKGIYE
jgi:cytidylate kinase